MHHELQSRVGSHMYFALPIESNFSFVYVRLKYTFVSLAMLKVSKGPAYQYLYWLFDWKLKKIKKSEISGKISGKRSTQVTVPILKKKC